MARRSRKSLKRALGKAESSYWNVVAQVSALRRQLNEARIGRRSMHMAHNRLLSRIDNYFVDRLPETKRDDNVINPDDVNEDFGDRREDASRSTGVGGEGAFKRETWEGEMPHPPYDTAHYVWQAHGRWWYSDYERKTHGPYDTQPQADIRMKLHHHNTVHGFVFQNVIDHDGRINPPLELDGITVTHVDHLRGLIKGTNVGTEGSSG